MHEAGRETECEITVVVPYFRDVDGLVATLGALRAQTIGPDRFAVVVVDNDPDDPVAARLPDDVGRGLHLQIVPEARPGSYAAREAGRVVATTELLAFTDTDCRPAADWLERGIARFGDTATVDVVAGDVRMVDGGPGRPSLAVRYQLARAFPVGEYVERFGFGVTANLLTRRSVFERVGGFDPMLRSGGDAEWCQRVTAHGGAIVHAPEVLVAHPARRSVGSLVGKERRVAGGLHDRMVRDGTTSTYLRRSLLHDALPPVRPAAALAWRFRAVPLTGLGLAGIEVLLNHVRVAERLRLLLGLGRSRRA